VLQLSGSFEIVARESEVFHPSEHPDLSLTGQHQEFSVQQQSDQECGSSLQLGLLETPGGPTSS